MLTSKRSSVLAGFICLGAMALGGPIAQAEWVSPTAVPYASPDYTAEGRGFAISTLYDLQYGPTVGVDNAAVMVDDTPLDLPATGHLVFDLGAAQEIGGVQLWSRIGGDAFPSNVDLFYFDDDDPTNNTFWPIDDIENDSDIVSLGNYALPFRTGGNSAAVSFGSSVTKEYIGLRLNDSWDPTTAVNERGNQIQEVMFWHGPGWEPPSSDWNTPTAIYSHSYDGDDLSPPLSQYAAAKSIDDSTSTFAVWYDDTTSDFPNIEGDCTGYVLFDLGESKTVYGARVYSRNSPIQADTAFPKDVDFFYYTDDTPPSYTSSDEIQIGTKTVAEAWSGNLLNTGLAGFAEADFSSPVTARYIGLKLNDTHCKYYDGSNQTSEIQFSYSPIPDRWKWTGANGTAWTGENNWLNGGGSADTYLVAQRVTFDDTAGETTVDVSGQDVSALESVVFDNSANDFVVQGTNGITGNCAVVKKGSGKVTLNGNDTYFGLTYIEDGTLQLGPRADGSFNVLVNGAGVEIDGGTVIFDYSTTDSPAGVVKDALTSFYVGFNAHDGSGLYYLGPLRTENDVSGSEGLGWLDDGANSTVSVMWTLYGDANLDGAADAADYRTLLANLDQPGDWADGDFNYDGVVDFADVSMFEANTAFTPGDANLDGTVDSADASILGANWLAGSNVTWLQGDFNRDGMVNDKDAAILAAHWSPESPPESVPEPSAFAALLGSLLALLVIRRRT